jgi:hypothetical protein
MSPVDDASEQEPMIEFSCRSFLEPEVPGKTVSWGNLWPKKKCSLASRYLTHHRYLNPAKDHTFF